MKSTKDLIEEAREMATELERMPLADALAYRAACTDIECNDA